MSDPVAHGIAALAAAEREGRIGEAAALVAALGPAVEERADASHLAGVVAARQGDFARAATLMDRAAKLGAAGLGAAKRGRRDGPAAGGGLDRATLAIVHRNRIEVHRRLLNPRAAVAAGREALALSPDDPVTLNNMALAHLDALEIDASLACYDRAIAVAPEDPAPHFGRGEVLLSCGDYARGWEGYGWRFRLPGVAPPVPEAVLAASAHGGRRARKWGGRAFGGTLLVVADQGFGDVVQFARFLPWAAARCGRLLVAASPEMQPVVAQFPEVTGRVASWDAVGAFDAWAAMSDLPALAGTRADTIPVERIPYLASAHEDRMRWQARLEELAPRATGRRVGLVWAGRPEHPFDFARSARLAALAPLGDARGVAWVALQVGPAAAELGATAWRAPLVNLGPELSSYADTMAVLDALDLVVTVDTSVAHVAGAMGRPCWLMLARRPDWRWGLAGEATGWYPSLRLFRQRRLGDWAGVAGAVAAALEEG